VISCDNAIPHLLDDADIPKALEQRRARLRRGGLLVVTMRDFGAAVVDRPATALPVHVPGPPRRVLVRLHDWDPERPFYTVRYLVLTESGDGWSVAEHTTRYRRSRGKSSRAPPARPASATSRGRTSQSSATSWS
jgi:glycine/sarcosine N-methyltransferase